MPRKQKQLQFFPKISLEHGGELGKGKRKTSRPIDPRRPMHIVLTSTRAKGTWSMLHPKHAPKIKQTLQKLSKKYRIRPRQFTNAGNHLHLLGTFKNRQDSQGFLREFAGHIAMQITGGKKSSVKGRFWDRIPFTRIVNWGRDFAGVNHYLIKNMFDGAGLLSKAESVTLVPI